MLACHKMNQKIRGIDWENSKGEIIVVGDYKGYVYLFSPELKELDKMKTRFAKTKPRRESFWIEAIKFSPNGQYVAFGAHGGASHLEIYEVKDNKLENQNVFKNIVSSAMLSVDWSQDSSFIAMISQAY